MTAQVTQAGCPLSRHGVERWEAKLRRMLMSENLRAGSRPVLMLRLLIEKLRPRAKV